MLLAVADELFGRPKIEESTLAVVLLGRAVRRFGAREFRQLASWIDRITEWSACDALCTALVGPLVAAESGRAPVSLRTDGCTALVGPLVAADRRRLAFVTRWARSRNHWRRRAGLVSLVEAARRGLYRRECRTLADALQNDPHFARLTP